MLILKIVAAVLNIALLLIIVESMKLEFSNKVTLDSTNKLFKQALWICIVLNILVQVMFNTGV